MARERMAKLAKYGHFEGRSAQIFTHFGVMTIHHHLNINLQYRFLGSWPSDEQTAFTNESATTGSVEKKLSGPK